MHVWFVGSSSSRKMWKHFSPLGVAVVALALAVLVGCGSSDSGGDREDARPDGGADVTLPDVGVPDVQADHWIKPDIDVTPDVEPDTGIGPCPFKTPCDDGDPCTQMDECSEEGICHGVRYECEDDLSCTRNVCDGEGGCSFPMRAGHCMIEGACFREGEPNPENPCEECVTAISTEAWSPDDTNPCDDGSACSLADACRDGVCEGFELACVDDGNECTDDLCDPATGECQYTNNTAPCEDGDPCTLNDTCQGGTCLSGTERASCDDGNSCTTESCVRGMGCVYQAREDGLECDDGSPCTLADHCAEGLCVGAPMRCNDGNPCTVDVCDGASPRDEDWPCHQEPDNEADCSDNDPCTIGDFCSNSRCRPGLEAMSCDDEDPCTEDICVAGSGCTHRFSHAPCDDGDPCTGGDRCYNGVCVGGSEPHECNDGNLCTDDTCQEGVGCIYTPAPGRVCSDNNPCTLGDTCGEDGTCLPGPDAPLCDDRNQCTNDTCDPLTGCRFAPNREPCDDGNQCTTGDYCQFAQCRPGPTPFDCDDGNPCTDDTCLLGFGCYHEANTASCEDGNPCTVGDYCVDTECITGPDPLICDDGDTCTDDACIDWEGCQFTFNTSPCDDGNPCTPDDVCVTGECIGSGWLECPDLGPCTIEFCEPGTGCTAAVELAFECRPQCIIDTPARGSTLLGPADVTVTGHVESPAGQLYQFKINDYSVLEEMNEDGTFSYTLPYTQHGMNLIVCDVEDEWGSKDHLVQTFLMSSAYQPLNENDPTASMIESAMQVFLGHEVFDDTDGKVDDLSSIIEEAAMGVSLAGLIPNPVTSGYVFPCGYDVNIGTPLFSKPRVDIAPQPGGFRVSLSIDWLYIPVDLDWCLNASARAEAAVRITFRLDVSVGPDGMAQAHIWDKEVDVYRLDVSVSGALGFLTNWLINFFEDDIADMVADAVSDQLGPTIEDAIAGALNQLAINEVIEIPAVLPGMTATSLTVSTRIGAINATTNEVIAHMNTAVTGPRVTPYTNLGTMLWDNCMEGGRPPLYFEGWWDIQAAIHDDFLNQVLYAAHYAGLMDFDLDVDLGDMGDIDIPVAIEDLSISVSGMLPPVITSCPMWSPDEILIQVGDLGVHASFTMLNMEVEVDLFAAMELEGYIELIGREEGDELSIGVERVSFVEIEIAQLNDALLGNENVIGDLLGDVLLPMVYEMVEGQSFGFLIPQLDLVGLVSDLGLDVQVNGELIIDFEQFYRELNSYYTVISGRIR